MFKYYNPQLVKQYRSYTVEQICDLFKGKKLHPQTVRDWVKSNGLQTVAQKPIVLKTPQKIKSHSICHQRYTYPPWFVGKLLLPPGYDRFYAYS